MLMGSGTDRGTVLPEQFDAFVWFEGMTAVAPLTGPKALLKP